MATKEDKVIQKQLQSSVTCQSQFDKSNHFSSFNLNHKSSNDQVSSSHQHSFSKSINGKNYGHTVTENYQGKDKTWNKSSKEICIKASKNFVEAKEVPQKRWMKSSDKESSNKNSSTLSLHIAAYENAIEEASGNGLQKLPKGSKATQTSLVQFKDDFEFPRQMDGNESNAPQVMQFKSSQKLLSKDKKKKDDDKEPLAEDQEYFHGFLDRQDLPALLNENGDFLVRTTEPNSGQSRQLVISLMYDKTSKNEDNRIRHFIIQRSTKRKRNQYTIDIAIFKSVPDLINHYVDKKEPVTVQNSSTPAYLKTPVARQEWELSHDDIAQIKKIGEGAFGEVWCGKLKLKSSRNVDVAIKVAKTEQMTKEKVKELMKEARLMRNFDHPNVVRLYGVAVKQEPLMIVMELVDGGALDDYVKKNRGKVSINEKIEQMCMGAAWGVEYLHFKMCIHRDIAARNCLYANNTVKISDFGLSREGNIYQLTSAKRLPIKWLAPETLAEGIYTQKTDVYSFGIMCWEIFSNGDEPYQGMTNAEVQTKVCEGFRLELHVETPDPVVELITKHVWDADPETRWSMSQIAREFEKITGAQTPIANKEAAKKDKRNKDGTITQTTVDRDTTQDGNTANTTCDQGTVETPTVDGPAPPSPATQSSAPPPLPPPPPPPLPEEPAPTKTKAVKVDEEKKGKKEEKKTDKKKKKDQTKEDKEEKGKESKVSPKKKKETEKKKKAAAAKSKESGAKSKESKKKAEPRKKNTREKRK